MWNVFEQPWTLLGISVLVLLGVLTFRSVWPEKRKFWQLLLPLIVAGSAFGLDALVVTDHEKVVAVTTAAIRAVQEEDCLGVGSCIASNYHDSRHQDKAALMKACQEYLTGATVEKIRKITREIDMSKKPAVVTMLLSLRLEEQGRLAKQYGIVSCPIGVQVYVSKQPDNRWLISSVELRAVEGMPMGWSGVQEP
jgi:hypothetical protein